MMGLIKYTSQTTKKDLKHECYNQIYAIKLMHILLLKELLTLLIEIMLYMIKHWLLKTMVHSLAAF